jgi:hypothetical protein
LSSDDNDKKTGLVGACDFITKKMSGFLNGKELPLSKSALLAFGTWVERQKNKMNSGTDDNG